MNSSEKIRQVREQFQILMNKLITIRENANEGDTVSRSVTYDEEYADESKNAAFILKGYRAIADVKIKDDPLIFSDHALTMIDKGVEFNSPNVYGPLVVRDVENFIVDRFMSGPAIIQAKNVYLSSLDAGMLLSKTPFFIIADNVFLGNQFGFPMNAKKCWGVIVCRNMFVMPFDGSRYDVPFDAPAEELQKILKGQDHSSISETLAKGITTITGATSGSGIGAGLFGGILGAVSNAMAASSGPLGAALGRGSMENITVCAANYLCEEDAAFIRLSADLAQNTHDILLKDFADWTDRNKIFTPRDQKCA